MIVYLARDIPAFVMYCVNGASCSSLLIESVDSMIYMKKRLIGGMYERDNKYLSIMQDVFCAQSFYLSFSIFLIIAVLTSYGSQLYTDKIK